MRTFVPFLDTNLCHRFMRAPIFVWAIQLLILGGMGICFSPSLLAQQSGPTIDTLRVVQNLDIPWDIEWGGNEQLWVTERTGALKRVDLTSGLTKQMYFFDDAAVENYAGVMGMELHPSWPDSAFVFVAYAYYQPGFQIFLRLARLRYDAGQDTLEQFTSLVDNIPGANANVGARLAISQDLKLFVSVGELETGSLAQDTLSPNGKVLRYNLDGSIPSDNPFPNNPVWTMGHRNPQGLTFSSSGLLYSSEHGTFSNDELNVLEAGRNYGWPDVSGFCNATNQSICDALNVKEPVEAWSPPIAPCGIAYYAGDSIPEWDNSILLAGLRDRSLTQVKLSPDGESMISQETFLKDWIGRIRDIEVTPEGRVFVCTSNRDLFGTPTASDDRIYEIKRTGSVSTDKPIPTIPMQVQWEASSHLLQLSWQAPHQLLSLQVLDIQGREIAHYAANPVNHTSSFVLPDLPKGHYLLRCSWRNGAISYTRIIQ